MPQLEILDRLIAVVVVLLLLSLLVQSIQGLFKQLLRFKSKQLESSLVDLFEAALGEKNAGRDTAFGGFSSLRLDRWSLRSQASPATRELVKLVLEQFRAVGRLTATASNAIESLAKEDLLKIVGRVAPSSFVAKFTHALQLACAEANQLHDLMHSVKMSDLPGDASAAYARMQQAISPILADLAALLGSAGQAGDGKPAVPPEVRTDLLVADVLRLRDVSLGDVLQVLAGVQRTVGDSLVQDPQAQGLKAVESQLKSVAAGIASLQRSVDSALSPLRARLASIETWYDTVMQGFEERYQRSMKTWALAISLLVVVFLNVNLLDVYRTSTADAAELAKYEDLADRLLKRAKEQASVMKSQPPGEAQTPPGETPEERATKAALINITATRDQIAADLKTASTLGLGWRTPPSFPRDRDQLVAAAERVVVGWLPAAFLVWLGAPFWHDALEALFGLKRLVRKRAELKNVEQESGAGNPRP